MLTKSEKILNKIKNLLEELYFPTKLALREMSASEMTTYKAVPFPNSNLPCIGSFLNIEWIVILDYSGLTIRPLDDANQSYTIAYHARSSQELATALAHTLDDLTRLTSEDQLFAYNFLKNHKFTINTNKYG